MKNYIVYTGSYPRVIRDLIIEAILDHAQKITNADFLACEFLSKDCVRIVLDENYPSINIPAEEFLKLKELSNTLPCPFCVKLDSVRLVSGDEEYSKKFFAYCCDFLKGGCGATGGYKLGEKEALLAWNTRSK